LARVPDEQATAEMIRSGHVIPGISDGGAHTKYLVGGGFSTDLLCWLVRDSGVLSLEEAHVALSALPARILGLADRGGLREGTPPDIVIYDLQELSESPPNGYETAYDLPAGDWRRVRYSTGYHYTIVNGEITFTGMDCTGATPGRLLRHGRG